MWTSIIQNKTKNINLHHYKMESLRKRLNIHSKNEGGTKMEEDKKTEQVKDKTIIITAVELESNPNNPAEINRVRFKADIGDITWKPKIEDVKYIDGMKVIGKKTATIEDLPSIIKLMGKTIQTKGNIKFENVNYMVMNTKDAEGTDVKYRFITSEKVLEKW